MRRLMVFILCVGVMLLATAAVQEEEEEEELETEIAEELMVEDVEATTTATATLTATTTVTPSPTRPAARRQSCSTTIIDGRVTSSTCPDMPVGSRDPDSPPGRSNPPAQSSQAPGSSQSQIVGNRTKRPFTVEQLVADVDCGQFSSWDYAQDFYEAYRAAGLGDRHRLDADGDGIACESLRLDTVPERPQGVTATAYGPGTVRVEWYDAANNEQGYRIEVRGQGAPATMSVNGSLTGGRLTHQVPGLLPNTRYCFDVRAYNRSGSSSADSDCVTTPAR